MADVLLSEKKLEKSEWGELSSSDSEVNIERVGEGEEVIDINDILNGYQIEIPKDMSEEEVLLYLAIQLFEMEEVSLGLAAQISPVSKEEFMKILGQHGIPIFNYSPEDLDQEMEVWENV